MLDARRKKYISWLYQTISIQQIPLSPTANLYNIIACRIKDTFVIAGVYILV